MKEPKVKVGYVETNTVVDKDTGEVIDVVVNKSTYLANTKEEFYLMYSSMILVLKGSTDVKIKLFAALLERYSKGQEFSMSSAFKEVIAEETNCKPRSLDSAFTSLIESEVIIRLAPRLYRVNPLHVFQGSTSTRNESLLAVLNLKLKE